MSKIEWMKKIIIIVIGSIIAAYGITLALYAGFGGATLAVLWQGISKTFHISIGMASLIVAIVMIVFAFFYDRSQIHIGTMLYQIVYSLCVDLFAMSLYPENYFRKLVQLAKDARIGFVTDPHTGPLHLRVKDLLKAGIPVALGQDDIADAYYPYGECNMLQVAFLASHLLWMTTFEDMEELYSMVTTYAGKVLGLQNHILQEGGDADLVVLQDQDVYHAIWYHKEPMVVIKDGKIIKNGNSSEPYIPFS